MFIASPFKKPTKMFFLIHNIGLIVLGMWVEKRFSPRFTIHDKALHFDYTEKKGTRHSQKIF
ncbi:hypothetical protein BH11BAC1_BH11BAC1_28040 [soil metagenome]